MVSLRFPLIFVGVLLGGILLCSFPVVGQDAQVHYQNGYIFFSQENYPRALEEYRKALEIDPGFHDARYWLGKTLEQMGDITGALDEWVAVLIQDPTHADIFNKWRAHAPNYARLESQEVERLYRVLVEGEGELNLTAERALREVLPYGFVLLYRADNYSSLYLAARLFHWAGNNVSYLFRPFSRTGYRRALAFITDHHDEMNEEMYAFLLDCHSRFSADDAIQEDIDRLLERIFARQLGVEQDEIENVNEIEILITPEGVTSGPGGGRGGELVTITGTGASFYVETEVVEEEEEEGEE